MIKFAGETDRGEPVLGIGLSRENCDRMLKGEPIQFSTEGMVNLPVVHVVVFAGETEEQLAGFLIANTEIEQIHEDKSLRDNHVRSADKETN